MDLKLDTTQTSIFVKLINVSSLVGITKLIVEPDMVRGCDDKDSLRVVMMTKNKAVIPDLQGKSLGISSVQDLANRLKIIGDSAELTLTVSDVTGDVTMLTAGAKKAKVQYRCTGVTHLAAKPGRPGIPGSFDDTDVWSVVVDETFSSQVTQVANAMKADMVTMVSRDGKVLGIEAIDPTSNDVFSLEIDGASITQLDMSKPDSFCHRYGVKLAAIMKQMVRAGQTISFRLTSKGALCLTLDGHDLIIVPLTGNVKK